MDLTNAQSVQLKARAKINLTLDVLSRRPSGYHDVEMIMQQIDLYDLVTVTLISEKRIDLTCSDSFLPTDERNIAYKAAQAMMTRFNLEVGFEIQIEKNIPVAAGLAGGSTNAAAVIKGINQLCKLGLSTEEMQGIGFELGADVPFCFCEGAAIARGLGEILEPIKGFENAWMILVKPSFGVSTKDVYGGLELSEVNVHPDTHKMIEALKTQNRKDILSGLVNVLETVTLKLYPKVEEIKQTLMAFGAEGVLMSGSGPTVFAFYSSYEKAKKAHKKLKLQYSQCYLVATYNKQ